MKNNILRWKKLTEKEKFLPEVSHREVET